MTAPQPTLAGETHGPEFCPNCGTEFLGDFCHRCGEQKHHQEELGLRHFFLHATHDLTHLDTRVFATLRYLFTRPGFLTREFIAGRRLRYMRPFSLFLIASAIFFLVDSIKPLSVYNLKKITANDKAGKLDAAWEQLAKARHASKEAIVESVQDTLHRANTAAQILNALAIAAALAVFFRKRYFVEHLVFSFHFLSFTFFCILLLAPLQPLLSSRRNLILTFLIFVTYLFFSMRRVYGQGAVATFFKAVGTYVVMQLVLFLTFTTVLVVAVIRAALAK